MRIIVSEMMLTLLLIGMLTSAFNIERANASGTTIYIRADGSVDPPAAPISSVDNFTYTFTDDIYGKIIVERDNITIDGNGCTLQGDGTTTGFDLIDRINVTVVDAHIEGCTDAIFVFQSNGTALRENVLIDNGCGIGITTYSYSSIVEKNIILRNGVGIDVDVAFDGIFDENILLNNSQGVVLVDQSSGNFFSRNNLTNNGYGFFIDIAGYNTLRANVIAGNNQSFGVYGRYLSHFIQDIDMSNTIDGKPICYWIDQSDKEVPDDAGYVGIVNSTRIKVENLNLRNNGQGILFAYTNYSSIERNTIVKSENAIWLAWSNSNILCENDIMDSYSRCIALVASDNNNINKNTVAYSNTGFILASSQNNNISENTVTSCDWKGMMLSGARNNTLKKNVVTANGGSGIHLSRSDGNTVCGNVVANNKESGLVLTSSSFNNSIVENTFAQNNIGVDVSFCDSNILFHNNFVNNAFQAIASASYMNVWDDGCPSGGNYWSDYDGQDSFFGPYQNLTGSDGIGDASYIINGNNVDNYPLMSPYEYWSDPILGDVDRDMKVSMSDIIQLCIGFGSVNGSDGYYWHKTPCTLCPHCLNLDVDCNGRIDMGDIIITCAHFGQHYP